MKRCKSRDALCTKNFTYTKKILRTRRCRRRFIKNLLPEKRKETREPNNRDFNRDWIRNLLRYKNVKKFAHKTLFKWKHHSCVTGKRGCIWTVVFHIRKNMKDGAFPANIYLFKVTSRKTRKMCEICLKLTIKAP